MKQLEKIDSLIDVYLDDLIAAGTPTDDQVRILSRLREGFTNQSKRRFDVRLTSMSNEELLSLVEADGSGDTEREAFSAVFNQSSE